MTKIQFDLSEKEAKVLRLLAAEYGLSGKIAAIHKLIAEKEIKVVEGKR